MATTGPNSNDATSVKVSQSLDNENTTHGKRIALPESLPAHPAYFAPTDYITDIDQRLPFLQEIQQRCENESIGLKSTAALWSALWVAPLKRLRFLCEANDGELVSTMNYIAMQMPSLLQTFLTKNPSRDQLIVANTLLADDSRQRRRSLLQSQAYPSIVQGNCHLNMKKESKKCEQRDRCCVVTGAAHPDVCYIIPLAALSDPYRISSGLSVYWFLWGGQVNERLNTLLTGDGNIINTVSNMVALQPLLHKWWSKAILGFEPVEKIENGIRLRIRWLPKTMIEANDYVPLDLNPVDLFQRHPDTDGYIGINHASTHQPIMDGTIIDITAAESSAVPNWDLFSLQWDLVRMASLYGAGEVTEENDWLSDNEDWLLSDTDDDDRGEDFHDSGHDDSDHNDSDHKGGDHDDGDCDNSGDDHHDDNCNGGDQDDGDCDSSDHDDADGAPPCKKAKTSDSEENWM